MRLNRERGRAGLAAARGARAWALSVTPRARRSPAGRPRETCGDSPRGSTPRPRESHFGMPRRYSGRAGPGGRRAARRLAARNVGTGARSGSRRRAHRTATSERIFESGTVPRSPAGCARDVREQRPAAPHCDARLRRTRKVEAGARRSYDLATCRAPGPGCRFSRLARFLFSAHVLTATSHMRR